MVIDLIDPQGFTHRVVVDKGQVHGVENIAHGFEPQLRPAISQQVLQALFSKAPLPHGFQRKNTA